MSTALLVQLRPRRRLRIAGTIVLTAALPLPLAAQALAARIAKLPDGIAQFNYPSREGACGDGRTYVRVVSSSTGNEFYGNWNGDGSAPACARGPVRIVVERADHRVVSLRMFVGPLAVADGATDLGAVRPQDAVDFLLGVATTAEGSVSQNAIMPAAMADSVSIQAPLLALARDQSRARETRRSAISWLSRDGRGAAALGPALLAIATDGSDNQSVRQQALRSLARLEAGAGIPALVKLAGDRDGGWTAREALTSLAQSGDPRSREFIRETVRRAELPDESLAAAIRSLGQQYALASDVKVIREAWQRLPGQKSQEAALSAIAEFGGADNARWLLTLAKDPALMENQRRRTVSSAVRAGASVADLIALFDGTVDYVLKEAVISSLAQVDTRESTTKLLAIAKSDESLTARKRAIAALAQSADPKVRLELASMAERGNKLP